MTDKKQEVEQTELSELKPEELEDVSGGALKPGYNVTNFATSLDEPEKK